MTFDQMIQEAHKLLHPHVLGSQGEAATVAAVLLTDKGTIYRGVNIDVPCSMGFCAEHSAAAAMVTAGESRIVQLVAVHWEKGIVSPCGRCREFFCQLNRQNRACQVLLPGGRIVTLGELLPEPWDEN